MSCLASALHSTFYCSSVPQHQILGIQFFGGTSREAVEEITRRGGLLVAPAAPSMIALCRDADYRRALLGAEMAIADSGFMVLRGKKILMRSRTQQQLHDALWRYWFGRLVEAADREAAVRHAHALVEG